MLGNGPYLCTQFMNIGLFLLWGVQAGSLVYLGLGNGPHVLGNGLHLFGRYMAILFSIQQGLLRSQLW